MKKTMNVFLACAFLSLIAGCKSGSKTKKETKTVVTRKDGNMTIKREAKTMVTSKDMKKPCAPCAKGQKAVVQKTVVVKKMTPKKKAADQKKKSSY